MHGQLFTEDFLTRGVQGTPAHEAFTDNALAAFRSGLEGVFKGLHGASTISEAQTEQDVIYKVLSLLGWADGYMPQVNTDPKGREAVPDALLEAKRWLRRLDRGDGQACLTPMRRRPKCCAT